MTMPMIDMQIYIVDPTEAAPAEDADPAMRPDIDSLLESIRDFGQKIPVLLAPYTAPDGKFTYQTIDGNGRRHCLLQLGRKMQALVLDRMVSESERIELEFAHNAIRRSMSLAEIAVKAALTGHLVLSTLHTNDAPSTINRLMNMGIEPFLVASSVHLICAQRLARETSKTPRKR